MKKTISISILVLLIICCFIPIFNSDKDKTDEKKDQTTYQQGYIQGKDIYEQFECVGQKQSQACMGGNGGVTLVYCQQTKSGGWVAWVGNRYIYTDKDVGAQSILNTAIGKFILPLQGLGS